MDSESCIDQTNKIQVSKLNEQPNKASVDPTLAPITPDSTKENGDFPKELISPSSVVKKLHICLSFSYNTNKSKDPFDNSSSPRTPKDGVFDPFAPGHEDKALAPQCKKSYDEERASVTCRLNFTSSFRVLKSRTCGADVEFLSDEEMFEIVYESLLEAIVLKQTEGALEEMSQIEWDSDDCATPTVASLETGVPETCPGAPIKQKGKSRIIDVGLCRKLEF